MYKLYEILNVEVEQHNNGQIIKNVEMQFHRNIPKEKINEGDINKIVKEIIENKNNYKTPKEKINNFVIIETDNNGNYKDCVNVFFPHTCFLDCVEQSFRNVCEFYFKVWDYE